VYDREPPPAVAGLLDQLRRGRDRGAVVRALADRGDAAPYLRAELPAATGGYRRDLAEALEAAEDPAWRRTLARAGRWAADGRLDVLAEALVACPDRDAPTIVGLIDPVQRRINERLLGPNAHRDGFAPFRLFGRHGRTLAGDELDLRDTALQWDVVRADRCVVSRNPKTGSLVAARSGLADDADGLFSNWEGSVLLVNAPVRVRGLRYVLLVCDGDVEIGPIDGSVSDAVVLANGAVRVTSGITSLRSVAVWAAGDITLANGPAEYRKPNADRYFAGGRVRGDPRVDLAGRVTEGASCPFGVRFLDPAEFGLALAAQNGGVQVMGVEPWSPFARYGVEDGDIITAVDDAEPRTLPEFRRALRRGVIRESVVLTVRRGNQRLARVVYLDGIPAVAPPPREVPPKPPAP
jgi:hypothetical protein